jgi:predicted dinucleotide-binding enzyme
MKVGIIGAGQIGGTLTRRLTDLGHEVFVANSRGPDTLSDLAAETGATAVSVPEAVRGVDLVVVTIPVKNIPNLPAGLLADTPDQVVVVDTGNYYPRPARRPHRSDRGRNAGEQMGSPAAWQACDQGVQQHLCQSPGGIGPT